MCSSCLLREVQEDPVEVSTGQQYDSGRGGDCSLHGPSKRLKKDAGVSQTVTTLGVLISACVLMSLCGLAGHQIRVACDLHVSGRNESEGTQRSATASACSFKIAATPAWAPISSLLPSWTDSRFPASSLTNNTSRQSSPEMKSPLASRAPLKPAPASSWSLLHPKSWLQGLSPFEAVSLLASEARVILTPVRNARFVVSLTTSPKRVGFLEPVLTSLQQNSLKPDLIIVNLPFVFLRDSSTFGELPKFLTSDPKILVNRCNDVGPATKILGALPLARGPDDVIIAVDDDIWYPRHHLKKLYLKSLEDPGRIVTGKSALPGFMLEGFSGVVYRRRFFGDPAALTSWFKAAPTSCFLADDFVLSNYMLNRGLSFATCNTRYEGRLLRRLGLGPVPLEHGLRSDALHLGADQKSKGNRENYAICRKFLESEGLLFPGFPDTSSVYFDKAAFLSQREAEIQEAIFNKFV